MSVMSDMLADMLRKALPPEVMEMLTPENIKALGERVNAFLIDHKQQIDRIEAKLDTILTANNISENITPQTERLNENVNSNDSDTGNGNGSGKRANSGRGKPKSDNG